MDAAGRLTARGEALALALKIDQIDSTRLGAALADILPDGTTVALCGTLGAGKTRLVQAIAQACGIGQDVVERVTQAPRARASAALARQRERMQGKRLFFFPDSQLEIPLARYVSEELGMRLIEVGTPYLHRAHLSEDLARLPSGTLISEGQDVERQLDRCRAEDLCHLGSEGIRGQLVGCRHLVVWHRSR